MISVAIATYNGEKYIEEQLFSIINQSLKPDEVIICDDVSTDATLSIVNNFIVKHNLSASWKLIVNDNNLGYIRNFIKAISLTKGDYIFLADQDDVFYKNKFLIMIDVMNEHSDCVLLNANFNMIDSETHTYYTLRNRGRRRKKECRKLSFKQWLFESSFPGFSMCFRSVIREKLIRANIEACYGHDQLLGLLALDLNGNYEIPHVLSGYRQHESNVTGGKNITENYHIESRIAQKEKEYKEYEKLSKLIDDNNIKNLDLSFLERRKEDLVSRIEILKSKSLLKCILMIFQCKTYPVSTLAGDLLYLLKGRHAIYEPH